MHEYWVIGGIYKDTKFHRMESGGAEEKYGPFSSYEEAKAEWQRLSWQNVDNALCRYRIEGPAHND